MAIGKWTDLDVDNLPERFFTRDDIEIQVKKYSSGCFETTDYQAKQDRYLIIDAITDVGGKYRYRIIEKKETIKIKSLVMQSDGVMKATKEDGTILMIEIINKEPIRITATIAQDLYQKYFTRGLDNRIPSDYLEKLIKELGREIIIID